MDNSQHQLYLLILVYIVYPISGRKKKEALFSQIPSFALNNKRRTEN